LGAAYERAAERDHAGKKVGRDTGHAQKGAERLIRERQTKGGKRFLMISELVRDEPSKINPAHRKGKTISLKRERGPAAKKKRKCEERKKTVLEIISSKAEEKGDEPIG